MAQGGERDHSSPRTTPFEHIEKPWGYELIFARTDRYVGKILHIESGHRLSRQYHMAKDETLMVQSGELHLEVGPADNRRTLRMLERDTFHVVPGMIHRLIGITDVDVIEVSTPELEDVIRLADDYGRESDLAAVRPASREDDFEAAA